MKIENNSFVLGVCNCGCNKSIPIISTYKTIQKYILGHHCKKERHYNWKGGKCISNGYILILSFGHPFANSDGRVMEHRLVMEKHLNRYLTKDEIVHHIDNNPQNNNLSNLKLMTKKQHDKLTRKEFHNKNISNRICVRCSKKTFIDKLGIERWYRYRKSKTEWLCHYCYIKYKDLIC